MRRWRSGKTLRRLPVAGKGTLNRGGEQHARAGLSRGLAVRGSLVVALALSSALWGTWGPASAADISEQQALAAAAEVAAALDIPFGEGASATLKPGGFMPPEWEVRFHSFSSVRVEAKTGRVIGIVDHSALQESYSSADQPAIAEEEAVAIADNALSAMGHPNSLVFKDATLKAPIDDIPAWICKWDETWQGIPYYRGGPQGASAWVTAATGKVVSAALYPPLPAPASAEVRLSEAEAIAIASDLAQDQLPPLAQPETTAQLRIVQPNHQWSKSGMVEVRYDDPSCVAWVVQLTEVGEGGRVGRAAEFWVDAADGSIVGGAISGGSPPPSPPASASAVPIGRISVLSAIAAALLALTATVLVRARRAAAR